MYNRVKEESLEHSHVSLAFPSPCGMHHCLISGAVHVCVSCHMDVCSAPSAERLTVWS